ncbi:ABC-three component system middle component 6 [Streptomyces sp. NPDC048527]|uniref:ABC-three component system middle component 6 n=1 Tax=Streptomyces sp. NPDC048527 TaxID=3365568 RepID=UPI00371A5C67
MITPTRSIAPDRALLSVGAQILLQLEEPRTVSQAWARMKSWRTKNGYGSPIPFGWFVLALDVLYAMDAVVITDDLLTRRSTNVA